ncbi:acyltransferase family protein (plasmid) [Thioclava sp. 'Guangxiensis']|uniref:acyltransferase family protein n=1 Tax=Thioclava sp. 'Guangxiensis' TaxID=3149044 RepID=UPI0038779574
MQSMARNGSVDGLRLIAAFGVVALHCGYFPEFPGLVTDMLKAGLRWAVPFFFMVTGVFLADAQGRFVKVSMARLVRLCLIFVTGFLIYLPLLLWQKGIAGLVPAILVEGSNMHLWFLAAMVIGLLGHALMAEIGSYPLAVGLAVAIVLGAIVSSYLVQFGIGEALGARLLFRELSGFSCLLAGAALHRLSHWSARPFALCLALGLGLLCVEISWLWWTGARALYLDWAFFVPFLSFGLIGLALRGRIAWSPRMAGWGRQDALTIYILHPWAIVAILSLWSGRMTYRLSDGPASSTMLWALASVLSLILALALRRFSPRFYALLNGQWQRSGGGRSSSAAAAVSPGP